MLAFFVGTRFRSVFQVIFLTSFILIAALFAYYTFIIFFEWKGRVGDAVFFDNVTLPWLTVAVFVGPLAGVIGFLWKTQKGWRQTFSAALFGGMIAGEGIMTAIMIGSAYKKSIASEIAIGVLAPLFLLRKKNNNYLQIIIFTTFAISLFAVAEILGVSLLRVISN